MSQENAQAQSSNDPKSYTPDAKTDVRDQLADDVERFLKQGGGIEEVPRNFRADPPKRPENNYGRGSI